MQKWLNLKAWALGIGVLSAASIGIAFALIEIQRDVPASVTVQLRVPDGVEVYLDEELTQTADLLDFGVLEVDVFGTSSGDTPVPLWVTNLSNSDISLTVVDDLLIGEVLMGFAGAELRPSPDHAIILAPGQVVGGRVALRFSETVAGPHQFTVSFVAEGPVVPTPTPNLALSTTLSTGDLQITVGTEEGIPIRMPSLRLFVTGDSGVQDSRVVPTASAPSPDADEWTFDFAIAVAQTYSVVVTVEDDAGNRSVAGIENPEDPGAITFEIDNALPLPELYPPDGADIPADPIVFRSLDWSIEGGEYPGDPHGRVDLRMAILDSGDANERDLVAERVASVRNGNEWSLGIANVGLGDHTLTFNGADDAGNTLGDHGAVLTFTVIEPPNWTLDLVPGMNLVSLPRTPADTRINEVIDQSAGVDRVCTLDLGVDDLDVAPCEGPPWLVATRSLETGLFEGNLTTIDANHAYWVSATSFVSLHIEIPPLGALDPLPTIPVPVGWSLVPVISLLPVEQIPPGTQIDADDYLGSNWTRAFVFANGVWTRLEPGTEDTVEIGRGYSVYFSDFDVIIP